MGTGLTLKRRVARNPLLRPLMARRDERRFVRLDTANLCRGVYPDQTSAQAATPTDKPLGYDNRAAAGMYDERAAAPGPSDYPVLFWIAKLIPDHGSLFDLGGHVGVSFYAFRRYLDLPQGFRWVVGDVPSVTERGRELAAARAASALSFTDDLAVCAEHPLLLASGSLQYLERSLATILADAAARPRHLIVNLTPFHDAEDYWTVQNIGTAYCPYHIQVRAHFVDDLARLGYEVVDAWKNPDKRCLIVGEPEHSVRGYDGFVFASRDVSTAS